MLKQATEPLPLPKKYVPDLPGKVESVLLKSLAKQPRDRYISVHDFIDELQNLLAGKDVFATQTNMETLREKMTGKSPAQTLVLDQSKPASSPGSMPASPKKRTWPILAGLGVFVLLAACGAFLLFNAGSFLNLAAPTQTAVVEVIPASTDTETPPTETLEAPATVAPTETETIIIPTDTPFLTEIQDDRNVTMVYIPAGDFTMGNKTSGDINNQIEQTINLDAFYIDKYEVTNEMYDACSFAVECRRPLQFGSATRSSYFQNPVYAKYPVVFVDWKMANAYCEWRGARLPTEAEWEKAAGGTDDRIYPWGSNNPDCSFGNMPGCNGDTTPVDQYGTGVSPYGVYGMAGNVLEWTSSLFLPYPYDATDGREDPKATNPRVLRGGSWHSGIGGNLRVDTREALDPASNTSYIGIRCAKSATP
jgi:formylglycine-generating enzyme required for sulfatase activity